MSFTEMKETEQHLNNSVLLSKALSFDRLHEEIWYSQQILAREHSSRAYMKFEHQISEGIYHT